MKTVYAFLLFSFSLLSHFIWYRYSDAHGTNLIKFTNVRISKTFLFFPWKIQIGLQSVEHRILHFSSTEMHEMMENSTETESKRLKRFTYFHSFLCVASLHLLWIVFVFFSLCRTICSLQRLLINICITFKCFHCESTHARIARLDWRKEWKDAGKKYQQNDLTQE